jgi:hypothetical protein
MKLIPNNTVICKHPADPWIGRSYNTESGDFIEVTRDRAGFHGRLNEREEIRNQESLAAIVAWLMQLLP